MSIRYHILGSDIPHHNHTLLTFFQNVLLPQLAEQTAIFYVVSQDDLSQSFPQLNIEQFPSKKAIARAVIRLAKQEPTATFLLHGQFNITLWFAILVGKLPAYRCAWHIWGADLYESSASWKFKLFYPLRRFAQQKFTRVWATRGDLAYFWQNIRPQSNQDRLIYFPTKMPSVTPEFSPFSAEKKLTILLGNSGDPANQHIPALAHIRQRLGGKVKIIIPMGYPDNNQAYIAQVQAAAVQLFPANQINILRHQQHFDEYLALLKQVDLGYFNFERQQGIGTICLLIQQNIPVVLNANNPFCIDMQSENVPFLFADSLTLPQIVEVRSQLVRKEKQQIRFFPPHYLTQWKDALDNWTL